MQTPWGLVDGSLELTETVAACALRFAPNEPFFVGHFPDYPLVPGVVLVESLVRLAQRWTQTVAELSTLVEAKFASEVRPNDLVACRLEKNADGFFGVMRVGERLALKARFKL